MATLRMGSRGAEVEDLQRLVNQNLPSSQRIPVDGDFGQRTHDAVVEFQRKHGLSPVDGIAGPRTMKALRVGAGKPEPEAPQTKAETPRGDAAPRLVTLEQLRKIMPNLKKAKAEAYIDPLNRGIAEFAINNRLRKAAFLAQIAHESVELLYMEEIASGQAYDITVNPKKAKELGNIHPGDGKRYKGRGPIQLTGRSNYRAAGKALKLDLEGNPTTAASPSVAFRVAGWFWDSRHLNALADAQNFWDLTYRINSARKHYSNRKMYYDRALVVLKGTP